MIFYKIVNQIDIDFKNKNTVHTVFMTPDKLDIEIQTKKKQSFWTRKQISVKESFENILVQ